MGATEDQIKKLESLINKEGTPPRLIESYKAKLKELTGKEVKSSKIKFARSKPEPDQESKEVFYIDFLNKDKGHEKDRKFFDTFKDAEKWGKKEFEKFHPDMINSAKKSDVHYPPISPTPEPKQTWEQKVRSANKDYFKLVDSGMIGGKHDFNESTSMIVHTLPNGESVFYNITDDLDMQKVDTDKPKLTRMERMRLQGSINEGETLLRASNKAGQPKRTKGELEAIVRSVNNARKKLGLPPTKVGYTLPKESKPKEIIWGNVVEYLNRAVMKKAHEKTKKLLGHSNIPTPLTKKELISVINRVAKKLSERNHLTNPSGQIISPAVLYDKLFDEHYEWLKRSNSTHVLNYGKTGIDLILGIHSLLLNTEFGKRKKSDNDSWDNEVLRIAKERGLKVDSPLKNKMIVAYKESIQTPKEFVDQYEKSAKESKPKQRTKANQIKDRIAGLEIALEFEKNKSKISNIKDRIDGLKIALETL